MSRKTGFCYIMLCLYLVNQPYNFLHITIFFYINKMYIYFYKKITLLTLTENIITPVTEYTQKIWGQLVLVLNDTSGSCIF